MPYYYLKLVYYACHGLSYGLEDQTLLINNEPYKTLYNSKWSGFFVESFKGYMLSKNRVQWLDFTFHLWLPLFELPLAKTI